MITPKLTENIVFDLVNSVDEFPVDFDLAYKWLEFTRKDNAKRSLIECGFIEGVDFCNLLPNEEVEISKPKTASDITKKAGVKQDIRLTNECFKTWGMMVATQKGKEVREYFLQCERKMKQLAANPVRTDWVLADLMENDVLASAVAALSQLFLSMGKEQKQDNPSDINYKEIGEALWVAAMTIQSPSPEILDEEAPWTPEVEFDTQRWCSMLRDALVMLSPTEAAKWLADVAKNNPGAGYFRSFPASVAIPGYQRGNGKALSGK
jgi:phage anti-repressor protein